MPDDLRFAIRKVLLILALLPLACAPGKLGEIDHTSHAYEQCPDKPNCPNKPAPQPPPPKPAPGPDGGLSDQDKLALAFAGLVVAAVIWYRVKGRA